MKILANQQRQHGGSGSREQGTDCLKPSWDTITGKLTQLLQPGPSSSPGFQTTRGQGTVHAFLHKRTGNRKALKIILVPLRGKG